MFHIHSAQHRFSVSADDASVEACLRTTFSELAPKEPTSPGTHYHVAAEGSGAHTRFTLTADGVALLRTKPYCRVLKMLVDAVRRGPTSGESQTTLPILTLSAPGDPGACLGLTVAGSVDLTSIVLSLRRLGWQLVSQYPTAVTTGGAALTSCLPFPVENHLQPAFADLAPPFPELFAPALGTGQFWHLGLSERVGPSRPSRIELLCCLTPDDVAPTRLLAQEHLAELTATPFVTSAPVASSVSLLAQVLGQAQNWSVGSADPHNAALAVQELWLSRDMPGHSLVPTPAPQWSTGPEVHVHDAPPTDRAVPYGVGPFSAGARVVALRCNSRATAAHLAAVTATLPAPPPRTAADDIIDVVDLAPECAEPENDVRPLGIWVNGEPGGRPTALSHATTNVVGVLNGIARQPVTSSDHLHIHGAALASDDDTGSVVVVGPAGAGKSTFTSALLQQGGHRYLTDEVVAVDRLLRARPYPKPLTLKRGSWPLFPAAESLEPFREGRRASDCAFVAPREFGAQIEQAPTPVRCVVVLAHRPQSTTSVRRLSPGDSARCLLANTFPGEVTEDAAFDRILALATTAPTYSVVYSSLRSLPDIVDALDDHLDTEVVPEAIAPTPRRGPHLCLATNTRVTALGDECLLSHAALEVAATCSLAVGVTLATLDGTDATEQVLGSFATTGPPAATVRPIVESLIDVGLLTR